MIFDVSPVSEEIPLPQLGHLGHPCCTRCSQPYATAVCAALEDHGDRRMKEMSISEKSPAKKGRKEGKEPAASVVLPMLKWIKVYSAFLFCQGDDSLLTNTTPRLKVFRRNCSIYNHISTPLLEP